VTITRTGGEPAPATGRTSVITQSDGSGTYGGVELAPGATR
jgi:hypothetical protein